MIEVPNLQENKNDGIDLPNVPWKEFNDLQIKLMQETAGETPIKNWIDKNSKPLRELSETAEIKKLWAEGKKDEVYEKLKNIVLSGLPH